MDKLAPVDIEGGRQARKEGSGVATTVGEQQRGSNQGDIGVHFEKSWLLTTFVVACDGLSIRPRRRGLW